MLFFCYNCWSFCGIKLCRYFSDILPISVYFNIWLVNAIRSLSKNGGAEKLHVDPTYGLRPKERLEVEDRSVKNVMFKRLTCMTIVKKVRKVLPAGAARKFFLLKGGFCYSLLISFMMSYRSAWLQDLMFPSLLSCR